MDENHCMWSLLPLEYLHILRLEQYLINSKFSKIYVISNLTKEFYFSYHVKQFFQNFKFNFFHLYKWRK